MNSHSPDTEGSNSQIAYVVGLQARKYFLEQKSARMGKRYKPNPSWDNDDFWAHIGQVCIDLKARPDLFILAQFQRSRKRDGPFPNQLRGGMAQGAYHAFYSNYRPPDDSFVEESHDMVVNTDEVTELCQEAIASCRRVFPERSVVEALRSPLVTCPDWLRILLAPQDEEIMKLYLDGGSKYLLKNPQLQAQCQAVDLPVSDVLSSALQNQPRIIDNIG